MMLDELTDTLRRDGNRPAVLGTTRTGRPVVRATRGELADLADGYAAALHRRGLAAGATLGLAARPGCRSLALMLAAHRLGLRVAILDPTAGPDVVLARLALVPPDLVVADAAAQAVAGWARWLAGRAQLALPPLSTVGPVATVGPRLPGCAPALSPVLAPVLAPASARGGVPDHRGTGGDAVVVFTSGTTSRPRAVVHTWASLDASLRSVADLVSPRPGAVVLGSTFFVLVPALARGASVALPARSPRVLARQLTRLCPQETYLVPPQLRDALAVSARFTGRVWTGSAPVSAQLLAQVRHHGATQAWGVYALTEMFPVAAVEAAQKAEYLEGGGAAAGDLVGHLVPGAQARVADDGQLMVRGPGACHRYLGEAALSWVATGDLARLDRRDGSTRVVLAGRTKDMILRRAENIYPGLYEPSLHVPGVSLALLVGVPAGDGDERLVAVVETTPGADGARVRAALRAVSARMGSARPDAMVFAPVPVRGRSRKPDRAAAARLAARLMTERRRRHDVVWR